MYCERTIVYERPKSFTARTGNLSSRILLIPCYKPQTKNELHTKTTSVSIKKSMEVEERIAEFYSKQGNTDITQLIVIDKTTAKRVLLHTWMNSAGPTSLNERKKNPQRHQNKMTCKLP